MKQLEILQHTQSCAVLALGVLAGVVAAAAPAAADASLDARIAALEAAAPKAAATRITLSGQVNRALLIWDDGRDSDVYVVDNDNGSTRLRLDGARGFAPGWRAGVFFEIEFETASSFFVNQTRDDQELIAERYLDGYLDGPYGRLTLGHGSMATDLTAESDVSGSFNALYPSNPALLVASLRFREDTPAAGFGPTVFGVFPNYDGLSRASRVRFDSAAWGGVQVSASYGQNDGRDLALRYGHSDDRVAVSAAIGLGAFTPDGAPERTRLSASLSVLDKTTGLNLTLAAARQALDAPDRADGAFGYAKLGLLRRFFPLGPTALGVDLYYGEDLENPVLGQSSQSLSYGAGIVQQIDGLGAELYAVARTFAHEATAADYRPVQAALVGARIKF